VQRGRGSDVASTAWSWYLGQNKTVPETPFEANSPPVSVPDAAWERVTKGVPVEVVGAYTAAVPLASLAGGISTALLGIVFLVGVAATYFAMTILRGVDPSNKDSKLRRIARIQIVIALLAFAVWAYAQGGIFKALVLSPATPPAEATTLYNDAVAGLLVILMGLVLVFSNKITSADQPA
jgi:hypothetical protein